MGLLLLLLLLLGLLLVLLLLLLMMLLLGLLLIMLLLLLLLLPTLDPRASPVSPLHSWTRTSTIVRLHTSGVQSMRIYHSPRTQCLGNHLLVCSIVGLRVTDDLIALGTGDGRAGNDGLSLYLVQGREVRYYMKDDLFKHSYRSPPWLPRPLLYPPYLGTSGGSRLLPF